MELDRLCSEYISARREDGTASESYLVALDSVFRSLLAAGFTRTDQLKAFQSYQMTLRKRGVRWATVARHTSAVYGLCQYAVKCGRMKAAPSLGFPSRKQQERERPFYRSLEIEERERFLTALESINEETHRWYTVAFFTGMRKSEIDLLAFRWVDFKLKSIAIPAWAAKSGTADNPIHVHDRALWAIAIQADQMTRPLDGPLFGRRDRRYHYERALAVSGIDPKGLTETHMARRTRGTQLAAVGGIPAVMSQLRHKHATTSERYVNGSFLLAARANEEAP